MKRKKRELGSVGELLEQAIHSQTTEKGEDKQAAPTKEYVRVTTPGYSRVATFAMPKEAKKIQTTEDFGVVAVTADEQTLKEQTFGLLRLPTGVTAVVGSARSGKTTVLRHILAGGALIGNKDVAFPVRFIRAIEPAEGALDPNSFATETPSETWTAILIALAQRTGLLVIDSMSFAAFAVWPNYSILEKGYNPGFLFWLTSLSNAAIKMGATIAMSFNPTSAQEGTIAAMVEALNGRVHGIITPSDASTHINVTLIKRTFEGIRDPATLEIPYFRRVGERFGEPVATEIPAAYSIRGENRRSVLPGF